MRNETTKRVLRAAEEAVSPVVATLMLVLVAAGAAVGMAVWLGDFQDNATDGVSSPDDATLLRIGGSSTVFEFSKAAIEGGSDFTGFEEFMAQQGTPVNVELEKGGSGAGRKAVGLCLIDIGSSSSPVKDSEKEIWPDCDGNGNKDYGRELNIVKVATDAVVFATLDNTKCSSGSARVELTEAQALELYVHNSRNASIGRYTGSTEPGHVLDADADGIVQWDELPGCGSTSTAPVHIFDRSDPGGTSEIASEKLFGQKQNQLEDFGVTLNADHQGDGNQGVLDAVEDCSCAADALFFTSFGYAENEGLTIHDFGTTTPIAPTSSNIGDESYDATRPILYITAGEPDPVEQLFLDFVTNPHRNQQIAEAAAFESIY